MKKILLTIIAVSLMSCVTSKQTDYKLEEVWYKGKVEKAFEESKASKKPLFIYWGAIWCPPCNEIKDQVFSRPRFGEIMKQYIPVYLDGDTEEAQVWADKLQAYGYPTILVFSPEGKELVRVSGGVNMEEFELALAGSQNRSVEDLVKGAQEGKLDHAGWRSLAYISWGQLPKEPYTDEKKWLIQRDIIKKVPRDLEEELSILSSHLLGASPKLADNKNIKKEVESLRADVESYLNLIFKNSRTVKASRGFINASGVDVLKWAYKDKNSKGYRKWKKQWLSAAKEVSEASYASVDTKLWASYPSLQFFKYENEKKEISPDLKKLIVAAALKADKDAKSKYERHSVVSGAAYLLRQVGAYQEAETILKAELKKTDTPWYYHSSLSALASSQGKDQEALKWSANARKSAQGRATKLQWVTNDLLLTAKVKSADQKTRLLALTKEFYQLATGLKDGFAGRNHFRALRVSKSLQAWKSEKEFKTLLKGYREKCSKLEAEVKKSCEKHFEELL